MSRNTPAHTTAQRAPQATESRARRSSHRTAGGGSASSVFERGSDNRDGAPEPARLGLDGEAALEHEADRVASRVLSRHGDRRAAPIGPLHARSRSTSTAVAPPSVHTLRAAGGRALEPALRRDMEDRFGHDFSGVRVHAGAAADASARELDAEAYAVGRDIVFRGDRFAPTTAAGRWLLAHELTHVLHQRQSASPPAVMRFGRSTRGFFANIFQFWDYSKGTLDTYLTALNKSDQIQKDDDSDDMARQIVEEWKGDKARYALTPRLKTLLIREMLEGVASGSDQERIMDLLEGSSNAELVEIFQPGPRSLTYAEIHARFKSERPRLELFDKRVLQKLSQLKPPDPGDKSAEQRLADVEAQHGIRFNEISLRFHLPPGKLKKGFAVDVTSPEFGATVILTLTRSALKVEIQPSLLIDVVWPLSNADLSGFTLTFAGLKPTLEIHGSKLVSGMAQEKVTALLKGWLAGTRFDSPTYNPMTDPHLIGELADADVIGDINRVKYNIEKDKSDDKQSSVVDALSQFSVFLSLTHMKGRPSPASGFDVAVPPGTGFVAGIYTSGAVADLKQKQARLERVTIESTGVFLYKGPRKIAGVKRIEMKRGLEVKLGEVEWFVDVRQLAVEESPGWARKYAEKIVPNLPRTMVEDAAVWLGEGVLTDTVSGFLSEHWDSIKTALGLTDEQIRNFFGTPYER